MGITCCHSKSATPTQPSKNSVFAGVPTAQRPHLPAFFSELASPTPHTSKRRGSFWIGAATPETVAEARVCAGLETGRGLAEQPHSAMVITRSVGLNIVDSETVQHKLVRDIMYPDVNCTKIVHQIGTNSPLKSQKISPTPKPNDNESESSRKGRDFKFQSLDLHVKLESPKQSPSKASRISFKNKRPGKYEQFHPTEDFKLNFGSQGYKVRNQEKSLSEIDSYSALKYSIASGYNCIEPQMPQDGLTIHQLRPILRLPKFCSEQKIQVKQRVKFQQESVIQTNQLLTSNLMTRNAKRSRVTSSGHITTSNRVKLDTNSFLATKQKNITKKTLEDHSKVDSTSKMLVPRNSACSQQLKWKNPPKRLVLRLNSFEPDKVLHHDHDKLSESKLSSLDASRGMVDSPPDRGISPSKQENENGTSHQKSRFALVSQGSPLEKHSPEVSLHLKTSRADFSFSQKDRGFGNISKLRGPEPPADPVEEGKSFITIGEEEEVDLLDFSSGKMLDN